MDNLQKGESHVQKYILLLLLIIILTGCKGKEPDWVKDYNTAPDYFKVAVLRYGQGTVDYIEEVREISGPEETKLLKAAMVIEDWRLIEPNEDIKEEPTTYLIINDETMLVLYSAHQHANIMNYSLNEGVYTKLNISKIFVLSDNAFEIISKYAEQSNNENILYDESAKSDCNITLVISQ